MLLKLLRSYFSIESKFWVTFLFIYWIGSISAQTIKWDPSLIFDNDTDNPLPTVGLRIASHKGELYALMGSIYEENNYSNGASYVYKKSSANSPWQLLYAFPEFTRRAESIFSVVLNTDEFGNTLENPHEILVVGCRSIGGSSDVHVWILDETTGEFYKSEITTTTHNQWGVRDLFVYKDSVNGVDYLFAGAGNDDQSVGIYRGVYDPDAVGGIRWDPTPETTAQGKWFGFEKSNNQLFAAGRRKIFKRTDGDIPSWLEVVNMPANYGTSTQREVRGLTAIGENSIPNQLMYCYQGYLFSVNAYPPYEYQEISNLTQVTKDQLEYEIFELEGTMNPRVPKIDSKGNRLIGLQFGFGNNPDDGSGLNYVCPRDPNQNPNLPNRIAFASPAFYYIQNESGALSDIDRIKDESGNKRDLILIRDYVISPFLGEANVIYACGYNPSVVDITCKEPILGTAWIYRGEIKNETKTSNYTKYSGIKYTEMDGVDPDLLSLDIYKPNNLTEPAPVMIYVHGGTWRGGNKSNTAFKDEFFTNEGYVFVSVNYRLSPNPSELSNPDRVKFPDHPEDVAKAIKWIYENIEGYGGDIDKISLIGHSAGAHLVSLIGTNQKFLNDVGLELNLLDCVCSLDGAAYDIPYYLTNYQTEGSVQYNNYVNAFGEDQESWEQASPYFNVVGTQNIPDFFLVHQSNATRTDISTRFNEKLTENGNLSQAFSAKNLSHGEINYYLGSSDAKGNELTEKVSDFFKGCLYKTPLSQFDWMEFEKDLEIGQPDINDEIIGGTEVMWIVAHKGKLFSATSYWNNPTKKGPQMLIKDKYDSPWKVDYTMPDNVVRNDALNSFIFTKDRFGNTLAKPDTLLIASYMTIPYMTDRSIRVFTRDDQNNTWIPSAKIDTILKTVDSYIRSFTFHKDASTNVEYIFAGGSNGKLYKGSYDSALPNKIYWDPLPEITLESGERFHSGAVCNGRLYVSAGTNENFPDEGGLYIRVDGVNPSWKRVYTWSGTVNSGMRGLTAVPNPEDPSSEVLIGTREYDGVIERITPTPGDDVSVQVELDLRKSFTDTWGGLGGPLIIAAYNRLEEGYDPERQEKIWFLGLNIKHPSVDGTREANSGYMLLRDLSGNYSYTIVVDNDIPIPPGRGLKAVRTIQLSPFPEDNKRIYYIGGFDAALGPHENTAWIYKAKVSFDAMPLAACRDLIRELDESGEATVSPIQLNNGSTDAEGSVLVSLGALTLNGATLASDSMDDFNDDGNASYYHSYSFTPTVSGFYEILFKGESTDEAGLKTVLYEVDPSGDRNSGQLTARSGYLGMVARGDNGSFLGALDSEGNQKGDALFSLTAQTTYYLDITTNNPQQTATYRGSVSLVGNAMYTCQDLGNHSLSLIVTDSRGNTASCQAQITILDAMPPDINGGSCPENLKVIRDPVTLSYQLPDYWTTLDIIASDNCTNSDLILDQNPPPGIQLEEGTHTITLSAEDLSGNMNSCEFLLTIENTLGIYPNPVKDLLYLSNPQFLKLKSLTIFDITGKQVVTHDLNGVGNQGAINVSGLSAALYIVILDGQASKYSFLLLKE